MITPDGYSKDPNIVPQGIALTLGKKMIEEKGGPGLPGLLKFLRWFEGCVNHGSFFMKLGNKPTHDIDHIYLVVANRLYGRCFFGGYKNNFKGFLNPDSFECVDTGWSGIYLGGPIEKPSFKRELKGFRGFRYTTKLF